MACSPWRRTCSPRSGARTIPRERDARDALARDAGFERINLDLIYGTPGESTADWRATLEGAIALDVSHVSAYALTVEPAHARSACASPQGRAGA